MKKFFIVLGAVISLSGCAMPNVDAYKETEPKVSIQEFFNGPIKGWGMVQDRSGKVTHRFDVDMHGSWHGNQGTLTEHFSYYDGKKQDRVWKITRKNDGTYEGTAADIIGKATGVTSGSAVRWAYIMDLPVGDTTYKIKFDDWMFQMHDGVIMNRSYLKKFGFTVAELTIFMQKQ